MGDSCVTLDYTNKDFFFGVRILNGGIKNFVIIKGVYYDVTFSSRDIELLKGTKYWILLDKRNLSILIKEPVNKISEIAINDVETLDYCYKIIIKYKNDSNKTYYYTEQGLSTTSART